ncbi:hypothetical protein [Marilutibacter alkalisoli]|uniref:hypothetical protein n=1 Tax=Marilutibacter alkalisoli TaxID=2591633 RepID=UPI001421C2BD|nr:hypothetical protein [Lysobacter alkalisoli]
MNDRLKLLVFAVCVGLTGAILSHSVASGRAIAAGVAVAVLAVQAGLLAHYLWRRTRG